MEITTANWVRNFSNALKALIGVTPAAYKIPYFTGASAAALTTLSAFARTILDDTSASEVRSTIGANAQNCGGIVAANLVANGYAKWANGLIIQWGYATTKKVQTIGLELFRLLFPTLFLNVSAFLPDTIMILVTVRYIGMIKTRRKQQYNLC